MKNYQLDASIYEKLLIAGYENLKANVEEVNDLNVFPIPDGDTGDNMLATLKGGLNKYDHESMTLGEFAKKVANGMLLSARGNSGVILSQMFAGISKGFENLDVADLNQVEDAFKKGVQCAYKSVETPVEGTMLTVLKDGAEYSEKFTIDGSIDEYFENYLKEVKLSLEKTPDLLDVLKKAGVIDSGGAGIKYIFEGFLRHFKGEAFEYHNDETQNTNKNLDFSKFNENTIMQFGYCTEFLLQLQNSKIDIKSFDVNKEIEYLKSQGDSIVAFLTGTIFKVHVHTRNPGTILQHFLSCGEFLTVKIENMTLQHNENIVKPSKPKYKINHVRKELGIVVVSNGDGMKKMLNEIGVDVIVDGGQSFNPSVEDLIEAYDATNADHIIIFPNNNNIIMAANKSSEIYTKSKIHVIETKNIGQAYLCLSNCDFDTKDYDELVEELKDCSDNAKVGLVSLAIRDSNIDNLNIKNGEYLGLVGKKIVVDCNNKIDAGIKLIDQIKTGDEDFIIAIYGKDMSDQEKEDFKKKVNQLYPDLEFYEFDGGQEIYDLVIILQ